MTQRPLLFALAFVATLASASPALADPERTITVFKTPWCGCCTDWAEAVEAAGYTVKTRDLQDLTGIKRQAGVSSALEACHTAVIGQDRKYVLEGHVPLAAIDRLMTEKPDIRGLAVPGMPAGSLGMGTDPNASYTVYAFGDDPAAPPTAFHRVGE